MKAYFLVITIVLALGFGLLFGSTEPSKVIAESGMGKDVFKVVVSLFGITNSTKDIITIVNVGDVTKVKLFNPENSEGSDKVSYVFSFPNMSVEDGEPYTVCTVNTDNFKLDCNKGKNSPLNRPEFVDVNVSANPGEKEK